MDGRPRVIAEANMTQPCNQMDEIEILKKALEVSNVWEAEELRKQYCNMRGKGPKGWVLLLQRAKLLREIKESN